MYINGLGMKCEGSVTDRSGSGQLEDQAPRARGNRHTPPAVGFGVAWSGLAAGQEPPS